MILARRGPIPLASDTRVTPYIWAMGLDLLPGEASKVLLDFLATGAAAPLNTGTVSHTFGLRDAWNQALNQARDAFLVLDTGWSAMGLLNGCYAGAVRNLFAAHATAEAGYQSVAAEGQVCTGFE